MGKRTGRDVWAGLLVALALVPYIGYGVSGRWPLIDDARGMAAVGVICTCFLLIAYAPPTSGPERPSIGLLALGLTSLAFAVGAYVANSWTLVAAMLAAILAVWLYGMVRDAEDYVRQTHRPSTRVDQSRRPSRRA
jgi:hypothetical protein